MPGGYLDITETTQEHFVICNYFSNYFQSHYTKSLTIFPIITKRFVFRFHWFLLYLIQKELNRMRFYLKIEKFNVLNIFEWPEMTYNDLN